MRKTLVDLSGYLKSIMVAEAPLAYEILPLFDAVDNEAQLWEGIRAFRLFLNRLYDDLSVKGDSYDYHKKVAHFYENRTTLSVYYPFLNNVKTILLNIGYSGLLSDNGQFTVCGNDIFNKKLPVSKTMECLRFLDACGIRFDGMDLSEKKPDLSGVKIINISYPADAAMLTGLKVMATAEIELGTLANQDVFLRCDYRILKKDGSDVVSVLQDTIKVLSFQVREFLLELHERYVQQGLKCVVEIKGFWIYIKYCYKGKDLWGINASLNNGFHINAKPVKTHEYSDTVKTFPPVLQELIAKGYGCGRKRDIGRCDGGCRGLLIPLDDAVLDIRDDIIKWFDQELLFLRKK